MIHLGNHVLSDYLTRNKLTSTHSNCGILFLPEAAITATSLERTTLWKLLKFGSSKLYARITLSPIARAVASPQNLS